MMGFAVLPPFQQRWMVWWAMVAPWVMVPHWAAIAELLGWPWVRRPGHRNWRMTVLAAQLAIAFALFSTPVRWLVRGRPETLDHAIAGTPWRLAETLRTPGAPSAYRIPALDRALREYYPGGRFRGNIFPNELLGDYLVWALPADYPVLAYSHAHDFSGEYWYHIPRCEVRPCGDGGSSWIPIASISWPFRRNAPAIFRPAYCTTILTG